MNLNIERYHKVFGRKLVLKIVVTKCQERDFENLVLSLFYSRLTINELQSREKFFWKLSFFFSWTIWTDSAKLFLAASGLNFIFFALQVDTQNKSRLKIYGGPSSSFKRKPEGQS